MKPKDFRVCQDCQVQIFIKFTETRRWCPLSFLFPVPSMQQQHCFPWMGPLIQTPPLLPQCPVISEPKIARGSFDFQLKRTLCLLEGVMLLQEQEKNFVKLSSEVKGPLLPASYTQTSVFWLQKECHPEWVTGFWDIPYLTSHYPYLTEWYVPVAP